MNINFWGTVHGVQYFLPMLKREERSHIVDLSSVFGLIAPPGQPAYSASKFAVRGFTECLRHELAGTPVHVSCVHPGGIRTAIARHARIGAGVPGTGREENAARFERFFRTSPEEAASRILRGVERSEPRILIGSDAYQIDILQRLRPGAYWKTLSRKRQEVEIEEARLRARAEQAESDASRRILVAVKATSMPPQSSRQCAIRSRKCLPARSSVSMIHTSGSKRICRAR